LTGRRGFTLVELMVALVVTALVTLLAHGAFAVAIDGARELRRVRIGEDRTHNAERWLAAAFLSLEVGQQGASSFEGQRDRIHFTSWLVTSSGWMERADVRLGLSGTALIARVGGAAPVVLADSVRAVAFDYLLEPGADSRWAAEWVSPVSAPIAVRLRLESAGPAGAIRADTVLYLVKSRG
jgi:prepilin-type N-terminal cleavage/methylation domain-containing protein